MAKKKTEIQEDVVTELVEEATVKIDETTDAIKAQQKENDELREQLKAMQAQMALLMQGMATQQKPATKSKEKQIGFVNMTNGTLVLKGSQYYTIDQQFARRDFIEHEARMIINNMPETVRSGMVYITDAEFVEENNLSDAYQGMLTDEQLKTLLSQDYTVVIDAYKNASDRQKEIIVNMVAEAKMNGNRIDGNILIELGELCGKNFLDIEKIED